MKSTASLKTDRPARRVRWVSGAASAVAAMLDWRDHPHGVFATCETGSEDADNERFLTDFERRFNNPIIRLKNAEYSDTWEVWEKRRFISGPKGAPCTSILKVLPRVEFQRPDDIHIFGYTNDKTDVVRAERLREHFFELTIETPLIERGIDKAACLAILLSIGIEPAKTYAEGFPNANCMPCGKATSPDYWALVRKVRPVEFARMVELSRRLGARLTRINNIRIFIDEIPADWPTTNPILPACDFLCHLAEKEISP